LRRRRFTSDIDCRRARLALVLKPAKKHLSSRRESRDDGDDERKPLEAVLSPPRLVVSTIAQFALYVLKFCAKRILFAK
jgi:hypothetical protein